MSFCFFPICNSFPVSFSSINSPGLDWQLFLLGFISSQDSRCSIKRGADLSLDLWRLSTQKREVMTLWSKAAQGHSASNDPVRWTAVLTKNITWHNICLYKWPNFLCLRLEVHLIVSMLFRDYNIPGLFGYPFMRCNGYELVNQTKKELNNFEITKVKGNYVGPILSLASFGFQLTDFLKAFFLRGQNCSPKMCVLWNVQKISKQT